MDSRLLLVLIRHHIKEVLRKTTEHLDLFKKEIREDRDANFEKFATIEKALSGTLTDVRGSVASKLDGAKVSKNIQNTFTQKLAQIQEGKSSDCREGPKNELPQGTLAEAKCAHSVPEAPVVPISYATSSSVSPPALPEWDNLEWGLRELRARVDMEVSHMLASVASTSTRSVDLRAFPAPSRESPLPSSTSKDQRWEPGTCCSVAKNEELRETVVARPALSRGPESLPQRLPGAGHDDRFRSNFG